MKKPRPRTVRRARDRAASKDIHARERLARLEPGGEPSRPIDVPTASLVEPTARASPCPLCGGSLRIEDHRAVVHGESLLRAADLVCATCGVKRTTWFRVAPTWVS